MTAWYLYVGVEMSILPLYLRPSYDQKTESQTTKIEYARDVTCVLTG